MWREERHRYVPSWLVRPVYRLLVKLQSVGLEIVEFHRLPPEKPGKEELVDVGRERRGAGIDACRVASERTPRLG